MIRYLIPWEMTRNEIPRYSGSGSDTFINYRTSKKDRTI